MSFRTHVIQSEAKDLECIHFLPSREGAGGVS